MARKRFFRHFPRKGYPLYWILIAYLIVGYFYPVVGLLALICMIAPVSFAVKRGRWWCGNACPRGSLYDRVLSKYSPHRPIPEFVRTRGFRIFMVLFIFTMFGLQMYGAWGDWNAAGRVSHRAAGACPKITCGYTWMTDARHDANSVQPYARCSSNRSTAKTMRKDCSTPTV